MSEPAEKLFANPSRLFKDGARAKQRHREYLAEIFAPPEPEPEPETAADLVHQIAEAVVDHVRDLAEQTEDAGVASEGSGFDGGARRRPRRATSRTAACQRGRSCARRKAETRGSR